ncbi:MULTISPECIES: non-heme iron oxygenase ferredoxin subunit [Cryobacterium]|jgi:3-phenylpropionate/trans-cinnamate dioxygenase ferredoxin subunit|uniref:Non-heme iron oxygenase ferredoxin subunit n=1 Tax=Cryobacterium gelidum TaxID=1259164 RepID=A0A4R9ATQ5_9MICO|nr:MULTISPECIES: non-heme iron oxygenase ferredoxin subunit [Cryobacterium]TFB70002.1 non-heme iron oxygenase ferredoxin subunit [Cryobacterium sp. Hz9]TFD68637.1 non-heme iron oxygenase ferredoxin subunit [Cryobacterium gelidum]
MTATKICALDELEVNQAVKVEIDGVAIALVRDAAGDVFAIGDTCTHGDISLSEGFVEGQTLECWAHGSMFSLTTGKPLSLPAYDPVPVYNVELIDGFIFVDPSVTVAV